MRKEFRKNDNSKTDYVIDLRFATIFVYTNINQSWFATLEFQHARNNDGNDECDWRDTIKDTRSLGNFNNRVRSRDWNKIVEGHLDGNLRR